MGTTAVYYATEYALRDSDKAGIQCNLVEVGLHRCSGKIYPAVKKYPPPVTLPSVLSAVCIAQN